MRPTRRTLLGTALGGIGTALAFAMLPTLRARAQTAPTGALTALTAQPGSAHLLGPSAPPTELYTYGATLPGPVLRIAGGEQVALAFENRLPEPTTLCWGGLRIPNDLLGVPGVAGAAVPPGGRTEVRFPANESGTYLFAPFDAAQAARGLAGVLVVEEPTPPAVDRDLVLAIQDWRLAPDQRVHLTANGEPAPRLPVRAGERVRLRIVNATRGLFLPLKLDNHPCWIIAIDGRPAEPFAPSEGRLLMAPGGRVDVLVDLDKSPGSHLPVSVETADGELPIASLAYGGEAPLRTTALPPPQALPMPNGAAQPKLAEAERVTLEFGDEPATAFLPEALASVAPGRTIVAAITNKGASAASIHLLGHAARLLDSLDDGWKPWWHDSLGLAPGKTIRIAFIAREPGRWPIVVRRGGDGTPLALTWFETGAGQPATPKNSKKRA